MARKRRTAAGNKRSGVEAALVEPKKSTGARSKRILKSEAPADEEAVLRAAGAEPKQPSPEPSGSTTAQQQTSISTSRGFLDWLLTNRMSIALTSYQTGQLLLIGPMVNGKLSVFQRNFVRAMGLMASPERLYLSTIAHVWRLENVLGRGQSSRHEGHIYDRLYVPRNAHTTGDLDIHEIVIDGKGALVFVNTKYSCLATIDPVHSFKPVWKPSFISRLAPEDRCHLNGLCLKEGRAKYATAVSRSDVVDGWRERRHEGGVIIDVDTDRVVTEQLSMPHSPRLANGSLWVLDSGRGYLCRVEPNSGKLEQVTFCPGFLRGLSFWSRYALIGASLPRDGTFQGLELEQTIKARDGEPRCGAFILDSHNGDILHWIRFEGAVRELFDVSFIPGVGAPMCVGLGSPEMRTLITITGETLESPTGLKV
jgi:uncharacterized protein (TIGR03032 family)